MTHFRISVLRNFIVSVEIKVYLENSNTSKSEAMQELIDHNDIELNSRMKITFQRKMYDSFCMQQKCVINMSHQSFK